RSPQDKQGDKHDPHRTRPPGPALRRIRRRRAGRRPRRHPGRGQRRPQRRQRAAGGTLRLSRRHGHGGGGLQLSRTARQHPRRHPPGRARHEGRAAGPQARAGRTERPAPDPGQDPRPGLRQRRLQVRRRRHGAGQRR
ncbi:hypothetical protein OY671_012352, partial [Metschnikowia pulcherrima]